MEHTVRNFVIAMVVGFAAAILGNSLIPTTLFAQQKEGTMQSLKLYLDTHDRDNKTFPQTISRQEFEQFYAKYKEACCAEGVIPVRLHVGYNDGKAFCLTMAPSAEAVKRAHERVGLLFGSITEVETATPSDTFFRVGEGKKRAALESCL